MSGKSIRLLLSLVLVITISSCGKSNESHEQNLLAKSFSNESPELQQHVAGIIEDARVQKYREVMNKLALLAATRNLTTEQKHAVGRLTRQLRYDMEEEIFSRQKSIGVTDE